MNSLLWVICGALVLTVAIMAAVGAHALWWSGKVLREMARFPGSIVQEPPPPPRPPAPPISLSKTATGGSASSAQNGKSDATIRCMR